MIYPRYSNLIISMALLDNMALFLVGFRLLATFDTVGEVLFAGSTPDASAGAAPCGLEQSRCEIASHFTFPTTTTLCLG